ncbi:MAG: hypothetical protein A2Y23_14060 [Clostridiales bacterium GWB2_37_7]|nr:MAG: hypothetical protein A2Y23_14060 [Clostridiales bacterium GWB2_37_7]
MSLGNHAPGLVGPDATDSDGALHKGITNAINGEGNRELIGIVSWRLTPHKAIVQARRQGTSRSSRHHFCLLKARGMRGMYTKTKWFRF